MSQPFTDTDTILPDANAIDYTNVEEICAYRLMLCKFLEKCREAHPHTASADIAQEIKWQAKAWLCNVKRIISGIIEGHADIALSPGVIPELLEACEPMREISPEAMSPEYIRKVRLELADRFARGDHSISRTDIVIGLLREADRDNRTLDNRYSLYAFTVLQQWIDELTTFGRFRHTPLPEAHRRLNYLMKEDIHS